MPAVRSGSVLRQIGALFAGGAVGASTDGELLARFLAGRGEAAESAFATIVERHNGLVTAIVEQLRYYHGKSVTGADRSPIRADLKKRFASKDLKTIDKGFYTWLGRPEMLKPAARGALEYSDVFPLVYMKMRLEGHQVRDRIKHVVIDEMRDYSAVQYRVISRLYPGKMTILGDRDQSVNPLSSSSAESIRDVLPNAECVHIHRDRLPGQGPRVRRGDRPLLQR